MTPKGILHQYQLAEAKKQIPERTAVRATFATILEAGIVAFHKGFYGLEEYNRVSESVATRKGEDSLDMLQEALLSDVSPVISRLREAHTSTDFPAILANLRSRTMRQSFNPVDSMFWQIATRRTTSDFKPLNGLRVDSFDRLVKRPAGTDVQKATFGTTDDNYSVANYELGFDYTWEMWKNDDIGMLVIAMNNLGLAARRTRGLVTFEAIEDALSRTTLGGSAGGPSIARVTALVQNLAEKVNADSKPRPRSLSDIVAPPKWRTDLAATLNSTEITGAASEKGKANPVYKTAEPHEEPMMAEVLGADWIGYDRNQQWLEIAVLDDFEGGPLTYAKLPDVTDHVQQGSFDNHSLSIKVGDAFGVKVTDTDSVTRVKGD